MSRTKRRCSKNSVRPRNTLILDDIIAGNLAIAILDVFGKSTRATPDDVIRNCKQRLADFRTKDKP